MDRLPKTSALKYYKCSKTTMKVPRFAAFLLLLLLRINPSSALLCSVPVLDLFCGVLCSLLDLFCEPQDCNGEGCWIETLKPTLMNVFSPPFPPHRIVCFVYDDVTEKAYLIGGVFTAYPVYIYDPATREWTEGAQPPLLLHHSQCVPTDGKIYIVSSYTESGIISELVEPAPEVYIYDAVENTWSTKTGLPEGRRRGGAASVLYEGKIYVSHGGGHGANDEALALFDCYDIANDSWTVLPDAPNAREHTGGSIVDGNKLCVAGGRDTSLGDGLLTLPTDCYNFETGEWTEKEGIPVGRRQAAYGTTCDGKLIVTGGEVNGPTSTAVDVFDGTTWTSMADLNRARFGHGLAVNCDCDEMYVVTGADSAIALASLVSLETYFTTGVDGPCEP